MIKSTSASPVTIKAYAKKVRQAHNLRNATSQMQDAIEQIKSCKDHSEIGKVAAAVELAFSRITIETDINYPAPVLRFYLITSI